MKNGGMVRLHNLKQVERADGNTVAVSRSGELAIADEFGRERERYKLPYGAVISVKEGERSKLAPSSPSGTRTPTRSLPNSKVP